MSSEVKVIFTYNGIQTEILCTKSDKLRNIFEKYWNKVDLDKTKKYFYLYNGTKINEELKYEELVNDIDRGRNEIKILVEEENILLINENIIESNEIICPICSENIFIKIKDYRINMYKCKNNHNIKNIAIDELDNIQKIDLSDIKCNECKDKNKGNTYNNEFYKCLTCNNNLCPLCKTKHNEEHTVREYDERNIICNIHNDFYLKYCNQCNKNICFKCLKDHQNHNKLDYGDIFPFNENNNEFMEYKNKLDNIIDDIIRKLINIKDNINIYKDINNKIINNNNRNYEILKNIHEFIDNNNKIIIDIKEIINENNINNKFKLLMNIYDKIRHKNYITAEIDIKNEDVNNDIRIINSFEQCKREYELDDEEDDYKYENEKEIKE